MKKIIFLVPLFCLVFFVLFLNHFFILRKAHSTFENYYAFRGCKQLLEKKADYGICKTENNQTIKIVKFNDKWYLDGDLPWGCVGSLCFGL